MINNTNLLWKETTTSSGTMKLAPILAGDVLVTVTETGIYFNDIYTGKELSSNPGGDNINSVVADKSNIYILGNPEDFGITTISGARGRGIGIRKHHSTHHHTSGLNHHAHQQVDLGAGHSGGLKSHDLIVLDTATQNPKPEWESVNEHIKQTIHHLTVIDGVLICVAEGGNVFAFDTQKAHKLWQTKLPGMSATQVPDPVGHGDNAIFFVSNGKLHAINVLSGCLRWEYAAADFLPNIAPQVQNDLVVMPGNDKIYIFDTGYGGKDVTKVAPGGGFERIKKPWIITNPFPNEQLQQPYILWSQHCLFLTTNLGNACIYEIASLRNETDNEPQQIWDFKTAVNNGSLDLSTVPAPTRFFKPLANEDVIPAIDAKKLVTNEPVFLSSDTHLFILNVGFNHSKNVVFSNRFSVDRNAVVVALENPTNYAPVIANDTLITADTQGNLEAYTFSDSRAALFAKGDSGIVLPHTEAFNFGTNAFSLEVWVRTTHGGTIISQSPTSETACGFYLGIANQSTDEGCEVDGEGRIQFVMASTNEKIAHVVQTLPTKVADGEWHHIAVVRHNRPKIDIYVDGIGQDAQLYMKPPKNLSISSTENIAIGQFFSFVGEIEDNFKGLIADVRFWKTALTAHHIQDSMTKLLTPKDSTEGLVAYLPLNENTEADYIDIISNAKPTLTNITALPTNLSLDDSLYPYLLNNNYQVADWPYKDTWTAYGEEGIIGKPVMADEVVAYRTKNKLYAIDLIHGSRQWSMNLDASSSELATGKVSFYFLNGTTLLALDAHNGQIRWEQDLSLQMTGKDNVLIPKSGNTVPNLLKPVVAADYVVATLDNNIFYAFHWETGEIIWYYQLGSGQHIITTPTFRYNHLYLTTSTELLSLGLKKATFDACKINATVVTKNFPAVSNPQLNVQRDTIFFWNGTELHQLVAKTLADYTKTAWNPPTFNGFVGMDTSPAKSRLIVSDHDKLYFLDYHSGRILEEQSLAEPSTNTALTPYRPVIHQNNVFCTAANPANKKGGIFSFDLINGAPNGKSGVWKTNSGAVETTYPISEPFVAQETVVFGCADKGLHSIIFGATPALMLSGNESDIVIPSLNFPQASMDFQADANGFYQMTVEAWVNSVEGGQIISHSTSRDVPGFSLSITKEGIINTSITDSHQNVHSFSTKGLRHDGFTAVADGEWHHIAACFKTVAASVGKGRKAGNHQVCLIYVNGVKKQSYIVGTTGRELPNQNFIGGSGANKFKGLIHDVRVWDFDMPVAEINERLHLKLRGNEAGLIAYWNFDNKGLADSSINEFHATGSGEYDYWLTPISFTQPMYPYMTAQSAPKGDIIIKTKAEGHGKRVATATYTTIITAQNSDGTPIPHTGMKIWTSETIKIRVIDKTDPTSQESMIVKGKDIHEYIDVYTDDSGKVELELICEDLEYSPELQVHADFMFEHERFRVSPVKESIHQVVIPPPHLHAQSMIIQDYTYTTGDDPNSDGVDVEDADDGVGIYHIHIDAVGGQGNHMVGETLELWADSIVTIEVDEKRYLIGPNNTQRFKTNIEGSLHIIIPYDIINYFTGNLVTLPQFSVRAGFMPRNMTFSFNPDEHSRRILGHATGDQLKGYSKNLNGHQTQIFDNPTISGDNLKNKSEQEQRDIAYRKAHYENADHIADAMRNMVQPTLPSKPIRVSEIGKKVFSFIRNGMGNVPTNNKRIDGSSYKSEIQPADKVKVYHRPAHIGMTHSLDHTKAEHQHWSWHVEDKDDGFRNTIGTPTFKPHATEAEANQEYDESKLKYLFVEDEDNPGFFQAHEKDPTTGEWVATNYGTVNQLGHWYDYLNPAYDAKQIYKAVKKLVSKVVHWVEEVGEAIVSEIHHIVNDIAKFVVKTVKAIGHALKELWEAIKMVIEKIVKFLKALFDWGEIVRLHFTYSKLIEGGIGDIKHLMDETIPTWIDGLFHKLEDWIIGLFDDLEDMIETSYLQTMSSKVSREQSNNKNLNTIKGGRSRWFRKKAKKGMDNFNLNRDKIPLPHSGNNLEDLITDITYVVEDLIETVVDIITALFNPTIVKVLEIINDFKKIVVHVIDLLDKAVLLIIEAIAHAIEGFFDELTEVRDIWFISWLYKKIADHDLTYLDLFSLFISIPVHVINVFLGKHFDEEQRKSLDKSLEFSSFIGQRTMGRTVGGDKNTLQEDQKLGHDDISIVAGFYSITGVFVGILKGGYDLIQGLENSGGQSTIKGELGKKSNDGPNRGGPLGFLSIAASVLDLGFLFCKSYLKIKVDGDRFVPPFKDEDNLAHDLGLVGSFMGGLLDVISIGTTTSGLVKGTQNFSNPFGKKWLNSYLWKTFFGLVKTGIGIWEVATTELRGATVYEKAKLLLELDANNEFSAYVDKTHYADDDYLETLKSRLVGEAGANLATTIPMAFSFCSFGPVADSTEDISPIVLGAIDLLGYMAAVIVSNTDGFVKGSSEYIASLESIPTGVGDAKNGYLQKTKVGNQPGELVDVMAYLKSVILNDVDLIYSIQNQINKIKSDNINTTTGNAAARKYNETHTRVSWRDKTEGNIPKNKKIRFDTKPILPLHPLFIDGKLTEMNTKKGYNQLSGFIDNYAKKLDVGTAEKDKMEKLKDVIDILEV